MVFQDGCQTVNFRAKDYKDEIKRTVLLAIQKVKQKVSQSSISWDIVEFVNFGGHFQHCHGGRHGGQILVDDFLTYSQHQVGHENVKSVLLQFVGGPMVFWPS